MLRWSGQNANQKVGPDKMPTTEKKSRTKCQPRLAFCPVGILSGWHFVHTPGKMVFSYLTMDLRSPMVANYLVAWICAIIPPLCLYNHMCAVHQGMNFCVQQLVQFSHRELFECILLKTQLAPLTSFWLIPLLFFTGGLSLKKLAVDQYISFLPLITS